MEMSEFISFSMLKISYVLLCLTIIFYEVYFLPSLTFYLFIEGIIYKTNGEQMNLCCRA